MRRSRYYFGAKSSFSKNMTRILKKKNFLFFRWVQSAVICSKCMADFVRFLFQNENVIEARVWRAQLAVIGIYNISILNFSGARVSSRRARICSIKLSLYKLGNTRLSNWILFLTIGCSFSWLGLEILIQSSQLGVLIVKNAEF